MGIIIKSVNFKASSALEAFVKEKVIPGNDHIVKRKTGLYEKSVLQAVEVLQKILRRKKTRLLATRSAKPNY